MTSHLSAQVRGEAGRGGTGKRGAIQRTIAGARFVALVSIGLAALLLADASNGGRDLVPLVIAIALAAAVLGWLIPGNVPRHHADLSSNDP